MERSGLRFEIVSFGSGLKLPNNKQCFFFMADFALQNMVDTTLPDGLGTFGRKAHR